MATLLHHGMLSVRKLTCEHKFGCLNAGVGFSVDVGYIVTEKYGFEFFPTKEETVAHLRSLASDRINEASKPRIHSGTREALKETADLLSGWAEQLEKEQFIKETDE
jgi:hypothetical protein